MERDRLTGIKLLQPFELRCRKDSRYFHVKRTQPFIITFLTALLSFKRLARLLKSKAKNVRISCYVSGNAKKNYLDLAIAKADSVRVDASFGVSAVTMTNIKPKVEAEILYRDIDTGFVFPDKETASLAEMRNFTALKRPFIPKSKKVNKTLFRSMKKQLDKYTLDLAQNNHEQYLKNFERKLHRAESKANNKSGREEIRAYSKSFREREMLLQREFEKATSQNLDAPDSIVSGSKPVVIGATAPPPLGGGEELRDKYIDYVKGTEIYYGSSVALQGKHGGFLSFADKKNIRASAHKRLSCARYVILKSSDLNDINVVRYGDAIWLQAGQNEVLGALFAGNITEGSGRDLRPALISSKRLNMFKAQQYGRWIIVNKTNPVDSVGKVVKHQDEILLEQEWYYLASRTPSDAFMWHINLDMDSALKEQKRRTAESLEVSDKKLESFASGGDGIDTQGDNQNIKIEWDDEERERNRVDFFKTGAECVWQIVLAGMSSASGSKENNRAALLSEATDQILDSETSRKRAAHNLLVPLSVTLPTMLLPDALRETTLSHKQTDYLNQKSYIDKFAKLSAKGFSHQPSLKFIENLYGPESIIYKKKKEVQALRDAQIGIEKPPVKYVDIITNNRLDIAGTQYWDHAQALLVPVDSWSQMDKAMAKFYAIDFQKKMQAAKLLQKMVRNFIQSRWQFDREFAKKDQETLVRRHKEKLIQRHSLLLDEKSKKKAETANMLSKYAVSGSAGVGAGGTDDHKDAVDTSRHRMKRNMSSGDLRTTTDGHTLTLSDAVLLEEKKKAEAKAAHRAENPDWISDDDEDEFKHKKTDIEDFFITRGASNRLIKISNIENQILDEVHHKPDHMNEMYTAEERKLQKDQSDKEMHDFEQARLRGEVLDNSGIRPILTPSDRGLALKRGQSSSEIMDKPSTQRRNQSAIAFSHKNAGQSLTNRMASFGIGERPSTAPVVVQPSVADIRKAAKEKERQKQVSASRTRLGISATNKVGLPAEVFDDFLDPVSLTSGIKFLRTQSHSLLGKYYDVGIHRKNRPNSASSINVSQSVGFEKGSFHHVDYGNGSGGNNNHHQQQQYGRPSSSGPLSSHAEKEDKKMNNSPMSRPRPSSSRSTAEQKKIPGVRVEMPVFSRSKK